MCNKCGESLLAIIIVASYVGNENMRQGHRRAISNEKLLRMKFLRIFLTGEIPNEEPTYTQTQILDEHNTYNDIIQGNFQDTQQNVTYKVGMGFKWAISKCPNAKYIIKVEDETIFDLFFIREYLKKLHFKLEFIENFIIGNVEAMGSIKQIPEKVSAYEKFFDLNVHFASGMFYVTNIITAKKLIIASQKTKYFWIENIYFTGILRDKIDGTIYHMNCFTDKSVDVQNCIKDMSEKGYECLFSIAPNEGDPDLFETYFLGIEKCYYYDKCVQRPYNIGLKLFEP